MSIYKRGNFWWVDIAAPDGTRIRRSLKTTHRKEAKEYHDKLANDLWRKARFKEKPRRTWDDAALLWLKEKISKKSIAYDAIMLKILQPSLRGRFLDEITREDIVRIGEERAKATSPVRANRYLALIRSILNRACRIWEWIEKVPAVSLYPERNHRFRFLSQGEIQRLIHELPIHLRPIVMIAILTGLRKSNILALRWDQIDLMNGIIIINGNEMKNGFHHAVVLPDVAKEVIKAQKGKHPDFVFTYRGKPIKEANTRAFREAAKRAGITDFRFHDLRHTWASMLIQRGVSLYELQKMGSWKSPEMVKRYAHLSVEQFRKNADLINGTFTAQSYCH